MPSITKQGIYEPRSGPEENYLRSSSNPDDSFGIVELVEEAVPTSIPDWSVYIATELEGDTYWDPRLSAYRKESGRKWPPVYHIRIELHAEELSTAEIERYWRNKQREAKKERDK